MKNNKLKMNLQYFAEPSDANSGALGAGGEGGSSAGSSSSVHKNVSMDDFNSFKDDIKKLLGGVINHNSSSGAGSNAGSSSALSSASSNSSNSSSSSSNASSSSVSSEMQSLIDQNKSMAAYINDQKNKETKDNLLNIAKNKAKELGVNISGMENNLLGGDEATTKQNVDAFAKSIKANAKSTDNGFNVNASNYKDSESFMKSLIKNRFPGANNK